MWISQRNSFTLVSDLGKNVSLCVVVSFIWCFFNSLLPKNTFMEVQEVLLGGTFWIVWWEITLEKRKIYEWFGIQFCRLEWRNIKKEKALIQFTKKMIFRTKNLCNYYFLFSKILLFYAKHIKKQLNWFSYCGYNERYADTTRLINVHK